MIVIRLKTEVTSAPENSIRSKVDHWLILSSKVMTSLEVTDKYPCQEESHIKYRVLTNQRKRESLNETPSAITISPTAGRCRNEVISADVLLNKEAMVGKATEAAVHQQLKKTTYSEMKISGTISQTSSVKGKFEANIHPQSLSVKSITCLAVLLR